MDHHPLPREELYSAGEGRDYITLLKPRVMSLSVFTALVGIVAAPGPVESWPLALIALLAIAVGAGASGALNMWWDADIDALMSRTKARPVPAGLVPRAEAGGLGLALSLVSVGVLTIAANPLAGGLLAFTIFFYVVIYSMILKRMTPQNIVIGGAAGALPPVVGWAAMTNSAPWPAWSLFLVIFLWTPPHFWALALVKSRDYMVANIPMMPNVAGAASTKRQILVYAVLTAIGALSPVLAGIAGWLYGVVAGGLSVVFVWKACRLWRLPEGAGGDGDSEGPGDIGGPGQPEGSGDSGAAAGAAKSLFVFSILYLFAIFALILCEHWMGLHG